MRQQYQRRERRVQEPLDDAAFLRRICLALTGAMPSPVEVAYFTTDPDPGKRRKVVEWLLSADGVREFLSKKLNVSVDQIELTREGAPRSGRTHLLAFALPAGPHARAKTEPPGSDPLHPAQTVPETFGRGARFADFDTDGRLDLFLVDPAQQPGRGPLFADLDNGGWPDVFVVEFDTDAEFLKRVIGSVRGPGPTALEEKYFTQDEDPKKREKLLDLLLRDPVVAKKLGADWKKKMLEAPARGSHLGCDSLKRTVPIPPAQPDRFECLVGELLGAKKTDEQVLDALTLSATGRLPTAEEKWVALAVIGTVADRRAAWVAVGEGPGRVRRGEEARRITLPAITDPAGEVTVREVSARHSRRSRIGPSTLEQQSDRTGRDGGRRGVSSAPYRGRLLSPGSQSNRPTPWRCT
jgi:hypothetical protein